MRRMSNNKPGGQADRTQAVPFAPPQPSTFTAITDSEVPSSSHKSASPTLTQFSILKSTQIAQR